MPSIPGTLPGKDTKMKRIALAASLLAVSVSAFPIGLTPSRLEINLGPGEVVEGTYTVTNDQDFELPVTVASKNWFTLKENLGITATDWLQVWPEELVIPVGGSAVVHYRVSVPAKAKGMLMSMVSYIAPSGPESNVSMALTVPIYLTVNGTEKMKWGINGARPDLSSGTMRILARVVNTGNLYIRPAGSVLLFGPGGKASVINFKEGNPVYPGRVQEFYAEDKDIKLEPGRYRAEIEMNYRGKTCKKRIDFSI